MKLPNTGNYVDRDYSTALPMAAAGIGAMGMAATWYGINRRKDDEDENGAKVTSKISEG